MPNKYKGIYSQKFKKNYYLKKLYQIIIKINFFLILYDLMMVELPSDLLMKTKILLIKKLIKKTKKQFF